MKQQEEEGDIRRPTQVIQVPCEEELTSSNERFIGSLDEWIHLVVSHEECKGLSFANGKREDVRKRILNSYRNLLEASIDFYMQISEIASKEGYEKEAQRYALIAEIYDSIRCQNEEEVKRRTCDK